MKRLNVDLGERSYEILIGQGLLEHTGRLLCEAVQTSRAVVVTHPSIDRLHGEKTVGGLHRAGLKTDCIQVPEGEEHKSLGEAEKLFGRLLELNCDRRSVLVALGGGVIGDLTGFVAATFMRGIPFIQAPTTLLAQVDSSVGGKTAVNHSLGKNMIGVFYQPRAVVIDLDTLNTLPQEEFRAGLAEVIKYGVIADAQLFDYLDDHAENILQRDPACLEHIVETSCAIKGRVVQRDEKENRLRMILNFGHTLGHAIEAVTNYAVYKHGEAIAIGMVYAARLSREMGLCPDTVCRRLASLVEKFGLPSRVPDLPARQLIESMHLDKKSHDERIRFVLAKEIGAVEIVDQVPDAVLKKVLEN
ncbi:MAG: 3-dehydroquinate synthase [Nitrospinales bacterium]